MHAVDESSDERQNHRDPIVVLGLLSRGSSVLRDGPNRQTAVESESEEVVDIMVEASRDTLTGEGAGEHEEEGIEEKHERRVLEPIDGLRMAERVVLENREDDDSTDQFDEEEKSTTGAAFLFVERHGHRET